MSKTSHSPSSAAQCRGPGRPRTQTFLSHHDLERVVALATSAEKPERQNRALKGQGEAALILRQRDLGCR